MHELERAHYARHLTTSEKVSDQDIQHWKYLRREKTASGKWRYYYEKDDAKLNSDKADGFSTNVKIKVAHYKPTEYQQSYNMRSDKHTGGEWKEVDKETYDKYVGSRKLYVGNTLLSEVTKEQVAVGKQLGKDLFSGNISTKKKELEYAKTEVARTKLALKQAVNTANTTKDNSTSSREAKRMVTAAEAKEEAKQIPKQALRNYRQAEEVYAKAQADYDKTARGKLDARKERRKKKKASN